jgi:hypothetical protein
MLGSCVACKLPITPSEGPALLAPPQPEAPSRSTFHLGCWLRWRDAEHESTASAPAPMPTLAAA